MCAMLDLNRHPCFHPDAKGRFGRIHLPVAPRCNIKCNYCNRKYDCVNESRPGVTSAVLSPPQAISYLDKIMEREPRIAVVGIAGPGDPLACPEESIETLRLVRGKFPEMILCLATNGLGLAPHIDDLAEIEVSHVTVTVNAVDPDIGEKIYAWARDGKIIYRGRQAAKVLLSRQIEAIEALKAAGITVKVNTIVVPGINDRHVPEVAREMARMGVDRFNCMPMYPNSDTPFASIPEPGEEEIDTIRREAEKHLPQMRHCTRCRADAVGLLDEDRSEEFRNCLSSSSRTSGLSAEGKPYVAVATQEGILVNLHMGEAARFQIWAESEKGGFRHVEDRTAPEPGSGDNRWRALAKVLRDCRAVLVSGIGRRPREIFAEFGIHPVEMNGFIQHGLETVYRGGNLSALKGRQLGCSRSCGGGGEGFGCG